MKRILVVGVGFLGLPSFIGPTGASGSAFLVRSPSRSDYFTYVNTNITFITLLIVLGTAAFASTQLKYLSRDLRFQIYRELLLMIDEFEIERHRIEDEFPPNTPESDFAALLQEQRDELERVCRSFDKIGMMVVQGIIPLSFIRDFHTRGLVIVWHRLASFVGGLRNARNQRTHLKQFQMLAIEAKKHRDWLAANAKKRGAESYTNEETFDLTSEDEEMWSEWRQTHKSKFWI